MLEQEVAESQLQLASAHQVGPKRDRKSEAEDKLESKGAIKCRRWAQDSSE